MSARDDYPLLADDEDHGGHEAIAALAELDSLRAENTRLRAARTVKLAKYTLSEEETDPRIREVRVLIGEAPRLIVNVTFGNHDEDHEVYVYDEATEDVEVSWQRAGVSAVGQEGPQP